MNTYEVTYNIDRIYSKVIGEYSVKTGLFYAKSRAEAVQMAKKWLLQQPGYEEKDKRIYFTFTDDCGDKTIDKYTSYRVEEAFPEDKGSGLLGYDVIARIERSITREYVWRYVIDAQNEIEAVELMKKKINEETGSTGRDEGSSLWIPKAAATFDKFYNFKTSLIKQDTKTTIAHPKAVKNVVHMNGYDIIKDCGTFGSSRDGWIKKLTITDWHINGASYDIRNWGDGMKQPGKGMTITIAEYDKLIEVLSTDLKARPHIKTYVTPLKVYEPVDEKKIRAALLEEIAVISGNEGGFSLRLNIMRWNNKDAKYDLRHWTPHNQPYDRRGIVMTRQEAAELLFLLRKERPNVNQTT